MKTIFLNEVKIRGYYWLLTETSSTNVDFDIAVVTIQSKAMLKLKLNSSNAT